MWNQLGMQVKCFSENFIHMWMKQKDGAILRKLLQCDYKDKVVILITFAFIKILGLLQSYFLYIFAENRNVDLLRLYHWTRYTVSTYSHI